jgi:heterodisulfide reductase subunit C2
MSVEIKTHISDRFSSEILVQTGVLANKCYQCGKCSAGCPVSGEMEYPPSMVLRMIQTDDPEEKEKLLRSMSIWLCVSCEMCVQRCPMEIDIPKLMDFLRQKSITAKKQHPKAKKIIAFHRAFLNSINTTGRLYEVGLVVDYKLHSGAFTQDVSVAPKMLVKGKLNLVPELIKNRKKMTEIFNKTIKK